MDAIYRFAPEVRFHPKETSFPASVAWYLERTRMRFHRRNASDKEFLGRGEVTVDNLVSQVFGRSRSGRGQRRTNFFLQIDDSDEDETRRGSLAAAECYVHVRPAPTNPTLTDIQYWFFSAYNPFGPGHEGDWEHVTVRHNRALQIVKVFFASHAKESVWLKPGQFLMHAGGGPVVYSALGSHACYASAAIQDRGKWYLAEIPPDDFTADGGQLWRTANNLTLVGERDAPLPGQEWIAYTGHWGEIGLPFTSKWFVTSGPYGPTFQFWWDNDDRGAGALPPLEERVAACVDRNSDGDTIALGGDGFIVSIDEVIEEIAFGDRRYIVDAGGEEVPITVVRGQHGTYLRTYADGTLSNNLDYLPRCP